MAHLPPDLSRLGDDLQAAAERSLAARRRRADRARRPGVTVFAALIFAALTPAGLGPADRLPALLTAGAVRENSAPRPCDHLSGAAFKVMCLHVSPARVRSHPHRTTRH